MRGWFGEPWGAGGPAYICSSEADHIPTPVGSICLYCEEPIEEGDSGVTTPYIDAGTNVHMAAVHVECHLRQGLGGVNHIEGRCLCCGGDQDPDPPGLTAREAAIAAVAAFERREGVAVLPVKRETATADNEGVRDGNSHEK